MLLWMGTSPDSHFKSTAGCIPACLKCLFVFEDAESHVKGLLPMIHSIVKGLIRQTAGMVIVKERHQPTMQSLHNGSYCGRHHIGVRTSYIDLMSVIHGAVHPLPLTLRSDSMLWYLSTTIEMNAVSLFYMCIIGFDALSNRCCNI